MLFDKNVSIADVVWSKPFNTAKTEEKKTKTLKTIEIKITQMSNRLNRIYEQVGPND